MCGIFAVFGPSVDLQDAASRLALLQHRGDRPVAEIRSGVNYFMGCHRLAMLDIDGGKQPATDSTGKRHLVHNGEIYNHEELRLRLGAHNFASRSDTEVVLRWFQAHSCAGLPQLRGMFAFCWFDEITGNFCAVRDPLGIKPLYYVYEQFQNRWFVASERKCLSNLDGPIHTVPPGHLLSHYGLQQYQRLPIEPVDHNPEELYSNLQAAVSSQLSADRPVGVLLSGGLDSSIVAYHAAKTAPATLAFSVGLRGAPDLQYAERLAPLLGLEHHTLELDTSQIISAIPTVIYHLESYNPILVRVGVCAYWACRLAVQHVRAVLVGEGADELFLGYSKIKQYPPSSWSALQKLGIAQLHRTELQRLDRMSMSVGLEARLPFLDPAVIRYALGQSTDHLLHRHNGQLVEKWCLREAYRGHLPDFIVQRPKLPFDEGSSVGAVLRQHAETALDETSYRDEQTHYPWLATADRETVYYYRQWKQTFLRENELYLADAGRYYARDEWVPSPLSLGLALP